MFLTDLFCIRLSKAPENVLGRTLYWRVCGQLAGPCPVWGAGCAAPAGGVEVPLGVRLSGPTVLSRCWPHLQGRSADCGAHQLGLYVMSRSPFSIESPFHSIFFMESKAWKDGSGSSCVFPVDPYLLGRRYTGKREEWLATGQRPPWTAVNAFYFKGKPVEKAAKFWFQTSILIPFELNLQNMLNTAYFCYCPIHWSFYCF